MNPLIQPINDPDGTINNNSPGFGNPIIPDPAVANPTIPDGSFSSPESSSVTQPVANNSYDPPAFHNPLATPYAEHTSNLPNIASPAAQQPANVILPLPANVTEPAGPIQPPLAEPASALPVSELPQTPTPAPVRLAPEPKSDDWHAAASAQSAKNTPFSGAASHISPQASVIASAPKKSRKSSRLIVVIGLVLALAIGGGGFYWWQSRNNAKTKPTSSIPKLAKSQRDTKIIQTVSGLTKLDTPCYSTQLPTKPTVSLNDDCKLDVSYGELKVASIIVSTYRDFDLVSPTGSDKDPNQRFDSNKFLQDLIKNTTNGKNVVSKDTIKVGNLESQKIVVSNADNPQTQVAYVYIVLPESEQQFNEKKFIAFIITAAYNDDYSRKNFDQALKLWYWK